MGKKNAHCNYKGGVCTTLREVKRGKKISVEQTCCDHINGAPCARLLNAAAASEAAQHEMMNTVTPTTVTGEFRM